MPKSLRSNDVFEERIKAYHNGDATSHWSHKCEIKKFPYGFALTYVKKNFNTIKANELTEDRLKYI